MLSAHTKMSSEFLKMLKMPQTKKIKKIIKDYNGTKRYERWTWRTDMKALHVVSSFFSIFVHIRLSFTFICSFLVLFFSVRLQINTYLFSPQFIVLVVYVGIVRNMRFVCVFVIWATIFTDMVQQNVSVVFKNSFRHNKSNQKAFSATEI